MSLKLRQITAANWQTCIHLQLGEQQKRLLATNLYSLAEAYVEPACQPRGIYDANRMIGFTMYIYEPADQCFWIPRFMIDARHQGKGYGRAGMQAVIDELAHENPAAPIYISITPANQPARQLYLSLGFEDTGRTSHGEAILCYAV